MKPISLLEDDKRLVGILNALGSPARMKIVKQLACCEDCKVTDVVDELPLAQSTISQHLKVLLSSGVLHDRQAGAARCCSLDVTTLRWFRDQVGGLVDALTSCS